MISNNFVKINLNSDVQSNDADLNTRRNFQNQSLPIDLQSNQLLDENDINLYNMNFNSSNLNIESDNSLNCTGINQILLNRINDQVHPAEDKFRVKKEMVSLIINKSIKTINLNFKII